jgi:hypothetical protein
VSPVRSLIVAVAVIAVSAALAALAAVVVGAPRDTAGPVEPGLVWLASCRPGPESGDLACMEAALADLVVRDGPVSGAAALDAASAADPTDPLTGRFALRCHELAHALGQLASTLDEPLTAPAACRSGFFHGVHQARFDAVADGAGLTTALKSVCTANTLAGLGPRVDGCFHALGHHLVDRAVSLSAALDVCATLDVADTDRGFATRDCHHGYFMERFLVAERVGVGLDPVAECAPAAALNEAAGAACAGEGAIGLNRLHAGDPQAVFAACAVLGSEMAAMACAEGAGRVFITLAGFDPARGAERCGSAGAFTQACIEGVATALVQFEAGPGSATQVCTAAPAPDDCTARVDDIAAYVEVAAGVNR